MVSEDKAADRIDAEAAAWLARLNGSERSEITNDAFQRWLKIDPKHERAFERATDLWEILPSALSVGEALEEERGAEERGCKPPLVASRFAPFFAVAAAIVMMIGAAFWSSQPTAVAYSTEVGEQQVAMLEDGSQVALNTDTEVTLLYDDDVRRVRLDHGEAMFDVAHDAERPFIVMAGDEEIRALGTKFSVRLEGDQVAVTLLEGRVEVSRPEIMDAPIAELEPGERMIAVSAASVEIDRPDVRAVTAWRRGEAMFDGTPLSEAVVELNRYGGTEIVVNDSSIRALQVSGVFATNDSAEFASAIAQLHGLRVTRRGDTLELSR